MHIATRVLYYIVGIPAPGYDENYYKTVHSIKTVHKQAGQRHIVPLIITADGQSCTTEMASEKLPILGLAERVDPQAVVKSVVLFLSELRCAVNRRSMLRRQ